MRFLILYQYHDELQDKYEENEDGVLEIYYDEELQIDESGYICFLISDYMEWLEHINVSEPSQSLEGSVVEFCFEGFEKLAYLPNLTELDFSGDWTLNGVPTGLDKLSKLECLNFYKTNIGEDDPEEDFDTLIQIAKSLPNLKELDLHRSPLADWLHDNDEKLDELKSLLPNCDIEV